MAAPAPCTPPTNPIACENALPGNPSSEWNVAGAGDASIQGFTTDISVNKGERVYFKISTPSTDYRIDIYRMGYYNGDGARKVATIQPSASLPQTQPSPLHDATTGLYDCGNWSVSASWLVPATAVSGIYFARPTREDGGSAGLASHIPFIVRDDHSGSDIIYQASDSTWHAYNIFNGNSLYVGNPAGRAYKVSYNRPFQTRNNTGGPRESYLFGGEYPMIRWLERNGYDVSYTTCVDSDRRPSELLEHKMFISCGHDEYWSNQHRLNVEAARAAGVHLCFFSGNEVFWKTRWENSTDGSATPYRTLVCYKESHADAIIDPLAGVWTGTWRDPRFSPPKDGGRPENALTGTLFMVNGIRNDAMQVPAEYGNLRFWRNTSIASLGTGATATLPAGTLAYEWDEDPDNGFRPPGAFRLSRTTVVIAGGQYLLDYADDFGAGTARHSLMLYRHSSGALVFGAGTVQWSWGLDTFHDTSFGTQAVSVDMQQATVNLFADMGCQPRTIQSGVTIATQSTDTTPPVTAIAVPTAGASVPQSSTLSISGTASDSGGQVASVYVSVDGGTTWHLATGRTAWSYDWAPTTPGAASVKSRAVDDSGNFETPGQTRNITVTPRTSGSIWPDLASPTVFSTDGSPFELGVKFRASVAGFITGIRFYKQASNTGTHVGNLWTPAGVLLKTATFSGETSSGWQSVTFSSPQAITANTIYVASYHAPNGNYARDVGYFLSAAYINPPLEALQSGGAPGPNGVFAGGASAFPSNESGGTNYWVDVLYTQ